MMDLGVHWLLTFLLHSTLLVSLVWLACRLLGDKRVAWQNAAWKAALGGALLTATFQISTGWHSPLGALDVSEDAAGLATAPTLATSELPAAAARVQSIVVVEGGSTIVARRTLSSAPAPEPVQAAAVMPVASAPLSAAWKPALLVLWGLGAGALFLRLGVGLRRLRRRLASRREVIEDPALETFLTLCSRAGVRRKIPPDGE